MQPMPALPPRSTEASKAAEPPPAGELPLISCASVRRSAVPRRVVARWLSVVYAIASPSSRHAPREHARAKAITPSTKAKVVEKAKEYDLPTVPPTHPAECLPVGWDYFVVATPACADACCLKPLMLPPQNKPRIWATSPKSRIGSMRVMRSMSFGSDVALNRTN